MNRHGHVGRCAAIVMAAVLLPLAALPARAQAPAGSYLETCTHVRGFGDRIVADCRRVDGGWSRTALRDVDGCTSDISNQNGQLSCIRGGHRFGERNRRFDGYGSSFGYEPYRGYYGR